MFYYFLNATKGGLLFILVLLLFTGCSNKISDDYIHHINKSQEFIESDDLDGAMIEVEAALLINDQAPEAYVQKGYIHMAKSEFNQAAEALLFVENHLEDFTEEDSRYSGLLNIGNLYYQREEYLKALDFFEQAQKIDSTDPVVYNAKGLVYIELNEYEKAKEAFSSTLDLDSSNFYAYGNLASVFLREGDYKRGLNEINTALGLNQYVPQFYVVKGELLTSLEQNVEAIAVYSSAIEIWNTYGDAYYKRGTLYLQDKNYLEAVSDFSYSKDYGVVEGLLGMGYAFQGLNQFEDAVTAFSEYLANLNSIDLKAVYEIAVSYYQLENYDETINAIDEILKLEPEDTEAMILKVYSLEKLLKYEEAMVVLESIIDIQPAHEKALEEIKFIEDNQLR